ncbi:hypothetical protein D9619_012280 [Psilocybe cf. subviscida]|uniref:Uncharacterized protein n=1 Tax=Psilocybe cf. subviscida TaxID=2480587 RepID=A0A8H5B7J8_9AGAR|nr:hypothetical protein D9619_012280 [Psilocybe cf. subviscida]
MEAKNTRTSSAQLDRPLLPPTPPMFLLEPRSLGLRLRKVFWEALGRSIPPWKATSAPRPAAAVSDIARWFMYTKIAEFYLLYSQSSSKQVAGFLGYYLYVRICLDEINVFSSNE